MGNPGLHQASDETAMIYKDYVLPPSYRGLERFTKVILGWGTYYNCLDFRDYGFKLVSLQVLSLDIM